jgi:hypothetical protein
MPIAFPPVDRGPAYTNPQDVLDVPARFDVTNLGAIGQEFTDDTLDPGFGIGWQQGIAPNLRNLGFDFVAVTTSEIPNPVPRPVMDTRFFSLNFDYKAFTLSGFSRDSTGAILGSCHIDLFLTAGDTLVQETTSAVDGSFWFSLMSPGPYYIVAYKVGSPDVAGTTVNTLQPV